MVDRELDLFEQFGLSLTDDQKQDIITIVEIYRAAGINVSLIDLLTTICRHSKTFARQLGNEYQYLRTMVWND